ncbi:dimethylsulfonioproprionate lyase family protein [Candidatus Poriferisodalis sp.]|uniref:dimethylsulfonioproprionate lyase family protein n=1 Tax=Candidatus Poriferisodalis sp. TaxID=3101277 RepID=UPI003B0278DA
MFVWENDMVPGVIDELLRRIAEFHRNRPVVPEFPMVAEVLDALDKARSPAQVEPRQLPVLRHLDAVELSGDTATDAVLDEFLSLAPALPWRQTAGYLGVLSQDFHDNYGYVQLVGPDSIVEHHSVRVGIAVWGPHLHYPSHHHEAEELYHVLAGEPLFSGSDGVRRTTRPGDAVHHAPWQEHCQDFGATPTVLLYCWTGAVVADAVLSEGMPSESAMPQRQP